MAKERSNEPFVAAVMAVVFFGGALGLAVAAAGWLMAGALVCLLAAISLNESLRRPHDL